MSLATGSPIRLDWSGRKAETWSWLPEGEIEAETLSQIRDIGSLDSAVRVAVMPDTHKGYGMPIGCMLATEGAVVPYAVGVDIGCGMIAARTTLSSADLGPGAVRDALDAVYRLVPVGIPSRRDSRQGSFGERQNSAALREWAANPGLRGPDVSAIRERADRQLGTLGSGNHFLELQAEGTGQVWFMLHTGSRSFGKQLCDHWHLSALATCESRGARLPNRELAYLEVASEEGQAYLHDMTYAMRFAEESRRRIYDRAVEALTQTLGSFDVTLVVETHHNFAAVESHEGRELVVHRKGAVRTTSVGAETLVTIPGSMQTGSYIGRGRASTLALDTCAHGAGRKLGRNAVRREHAGVDIRKEMASERIVLVCPPDADVLDESKRAYKDIENVMHRQRDLVEPVVRLAPLGVMTG